MDATQMISDSILESEDEESEEENENKRGQPMAKLCILKNQHLPESELPLFLGDNVLGRDPNISTLPLEAPSISKKHATICISAYKRKGFDSAMDIEALIWDHGSMNGTRKGRLKLTPNVRYALSEEDSLVVADIPCKYVSCVVDEVFSQGDTRTQARKNNGVKPSFPDVSEEKKSDASVNSNNDVNGEAGVSLPEDLNDTPARHGCLSLEQTPIQPQASLVPESDSDSDGERGGAGERRRKALVSSSDLNKPSPTCSTFLSPVNKVVPESEDESPITPSSATKNRPYKHVSFSTEEKDMDVRRQQPKEKKTLEFVEDSEDEGGTEEEEEALVGKKSAESGHHVPVKQDGNDSLTRQPELPVSATEVVTNAIPALNMDSDTDMEGEEEGGPSTSPVALHAKQKADQPADTDQFHMDSDTDVDEDNDVLDSVAKQVPPFADTKPPHVISVIQPEDITVDSDTDVDDDDALSDAATKAKPVSFQSPQTADSAQSTQQKQFHLDSDTDVDEEEEQACGTTTTKMDETPSILEIKPSGSDSALAASHSPHLDSDTDDETTPAPAASDPSAASTVRESSTAADKGADLGILSDSDTDVEAEPQLVIPATVTSLSVTPGNNSEALHLDANADTSVDESRAPPAGVGVQLADCRSDGDEEGGSKEAGEEDQIPSLCRENTPAFLAPPLQNCSTPVQVSGGKIEDMDTQAFLSPTSGPHRNAAAEGLKTFTSLSDSYDDEDFIVAETQSFVLQTRERQSNPPENPSQTPVLDSSGDEKGKKSIRGGSFQLGLSDSSNLQGPAQALANESTQAFVAVDGAVSQEQTQAYEANFNTDTVSLEATQVYGNAMSEKGGEVNFALEATQAYVSESHCDSEDESDGEDRKSTASAETQPLDFDTSSTLAMAETQPVSAFDEECLDEEFNVSTVEVKPKTQRETEDGERVEAVQTQEMQLSKALMEAETQPICTSGNEENDDDDDDEEDSIITSRKRKAKPLELDDEQTQPLSSSEPSAVETQPMEAAGDEGSDEENFIPGPRKRKAKRLHIQDEESQTLTNSELSENQPVAAGQHGEGDDEDSIPGPRKRKAKPLQSEEEDTQPIITQPMKTNPQSENNRQSDAGTSGTRVRNTRRSRVEDKQEECSEPPPRQTRGNTKALPTTRGRRGKSRLDECEEEEEVEQGKKTRGKKPTRKEKEEEEERLKREENERLEVEKRKEQEEKERAENAQKEKELESERKRVEQMEKDRLEREKADKEEKKILEREMKEEEKRKEQEEKERADNAQKEKELESERKRVEQMEKDRLEQEKADKAEKKRLEREMKEEEKRKEKERSETAKRELEERLERERNEQERERLEKEAKENQMKEQQERNEKEKTETLSRGRRGARRTMAAPPVAQESNLSIDDDVPARRTRSRSSSSNSVSSERSTSSVNMQASRGRGRGRGREAKRSSEPPAAAPVRSSNRRRTVATGPTQQEDDNVSPQGVLSRSSSTQSLNSDISSSSLQSRGRGGRQRGRGRKSEADFSVPSVIQSDQSSAPKPAARGRKGKKAEESLNEGFDEDKKADSQQANTTRGRQQAAENTAAEEGPSNQESAKGDETPVSKRNVRGQKTVKSEPVVGQEAPSVSDGDESNRKGRKRELEANTEEPSGSSRISKGKEKAQTKKAEEEEEEEGKAKNETPVKPNKRVRASIAQAKRSPTELGTKEEEMVEEPVGSKGRGRSSAVQNKKKEEQGSGSSVEAEASEPQTPTSNASRKRQASTDFTPIAKTPRSSSASPAASGRLQAGSQTYQVLFTGVVDEAGEKVLARLGGCMAKGVADMNCLVTDKVRRTVKFLCAVAKGVPIVNTHWLEKSGKAGSFLSPNAFVVKDPEQEKKFSFCLQESLRIAASQPLLQGYEIHVTKSVKPEPLHMKDIISCSGATFLPKMPSSHKPQTVVISCEEDLSLCGPAFSASLPVVTAEFILSGILQQKLDLQTHSLSAPAQAGGGRGRGRRKT